MYDALILYFFLVYHVHRTFSTHFRKEGFFCVIQTSPLLSLWPDQTVS